MQRIRSVKNGNFAQLFGVLISIFSELTQQNLRLKEELEVAQKMVQKGNNREGLLAVISGFEYLGSQHHFAES